MSQRYTANAIQVMFDLEAQRRRGGGLEIQPELIQCDSAGPADEIELRVQTYVLAGVSVDDLRSLAEAASANVVSYQDQQDRLAREREVVEEVKRKVEEEKTSRAGADVERLQ